MPEPVATATLDQQTIKNLRETIKALEQASLAARPTIKKKKKKTGGGASGGAASDKDKSKYSGSACEMCDKETVAIFTARKHFLQCDTKDGRQHYLNIEYLKKQPKDASLVAPHNKFKTQTVLLDGPKKALDLTEKASADADKPIRVKQRTRDPNPFVCADCYVGFLADYQRMGVLGDDV